MITLDSNIIFSGATSQYDCLNINSITKFGNKYLVATSTGLFELTEENDDGVAISSYFKTPLMHFGLTNQKRLRFVYVKYEANAEITLKITTDENESEEYYLPSTNDLQSVYRLTVNRSLNGSYWQFMFSGASFSIDEISVLPIIRRHKLI